MERPNKWRPEELGACGGVPESSFAVDADNGTGLFTDQESYLNEIHTQFLEKVRVDQSGILDTLREAEVLSSEDEQSITGGSTRREKARRLLKVLHRIPEEDFVDSFLPKFQEEYPHVAAGREFKLARPSSVRCLRHAMIKRLNMMRLVDILPALNCCSQDDYNRLQAVQHCGEKEWVPVFRLLQENASNAQLCQAVEKLLQRKKINQPESYSVAARGGFVCTCMAPCPTLATSIQETLPTQNPMRMEDRFAAMELRDNNSSAQYPSSPPSSRKSIQSYDDLECTDSGIMSIAADDSDPFSSAPPQEDRFETVQHKDEYIVVLNLINNAITTATFTRTDLKRLEMIRDSARSHSKPAKDEAASEENGRKLQGLLADAEKHRSNAEELYQEVLRAWEKVENSGVYYFDFHLPGSWQQLLMIRYHLLRNEVAECKHVTETAKKVLEEIRKICQQDPQ